MNRHFSQQTQESELDGIIEEASKLLMSGVCVNFCCWFVSALERWERVEVNEAQWRVLVIPSVTG